VIDANQNEHTLDRVLDVARFYLDFWLAHPDHHRIFWAVDNEQVIGSLPREMLDNIEKAWRRYVGVVQELIEEGVRRGELVPCDSWTLVHTLYLLGSSLFDTDQTRIRRRVRGASLEHSYLYSIETLLRGVLAPGGREPKGWRKSADDAEADADAD
jgi:AcrR family transcriptional regulator